MDGDPEELRTLPQAMQLIGEIELSYQPRCLTAGPLLGTALFYLYSLHTKEEGFSSFFVFKAKGTFARSIILAPHMYEFL